MLPRMDILSQSVDAVEHHGRLEKPENQPHEGADEQSQREMGKEKPCPKTRQGGLSGVLSNARFRLFHRFLTLGA